MDRLWAPWRYKYISMVDEPDDGCVFCRKDELVVFEGALCLVRLNKFPYNNGHLLIMPKRHIGRLEDLSEEEILHLWKLVIFCKQTLDRLIRPSGYNIGINLGRTSGAGIEEHLHIHLVPRWNGDTNFMPVLADTKVISQSLEEMKKMLVKEFEGFSL